MTEIETDSVVYDGPDGPFEGVRCRPVGTDGPTPGVMVCHAFGGQSDIDVGHAERLARLGYIGFAVDVYGQGRRAANPEEANALMGEMNADRAKLLERLQIALRQ